MKKEVIEIPIDKRVKEFNEAWEKLIIAMCEATGVSGVVKYLSKKLK